MKIRDLAEATSILNGFIPRPLNVREVYNLDTIRKLVAFIGDPQDTLRVVHVAGTSGKTSTAYYTAALLQAAGKKVGLTVSPHITSITERVQINLVPMAANTFCKELGIFMDEVTRSGLKPSYFELMMAFAYWEFARQEVDYAVVEVGLGGLLDGSNVVTRTDKVCVITDIGFDHMGVLGSTLPEITAQKAGIIQPHNTVYMHQQSAEIMDVVRATCQKQQAELHGIEVALGDMPPFLPLYQRRNMHIAAAAVRFVLAREHEQLMPEHIIAAARTHIPGRMETFHIGKKTVVLDGAHNPQKLQAMVDSMHATYPDQDTAALIGFVHSKEISLPENAHIIANVASRLIVTSFSSAQEHGGESIDASIVAAACTQAGVKDVQVETDHHAALQALLDGPERVLLVTGSLYLVSYLRPLVLDLLQKKI